MRGPLGDTLGGTSEAQNTLPDSLIIALRALSIAAGDQILMHYAAGAASESKADGSPITAADRAAHEWIVARLPALMPGVPIISEESFDAAEPIPDGDFWLVDPLDGTKEFLSRNGEFTVNIALIQQKTPVLGVVHVPVTGVTYAGDTGVYGDAAPQTWTWSSPDAQAQPIGVRQVPPEGLTVLASRSHGNNAALDHFLVGRTVAKVINAGSSLKFCVVARGDADVYPRFGPTMEWDTAAGHAVLLAAAGQVLTLEGLPLTYGKAGLRNPGFIASSERHAATSRLTGSDP